MKPTPPLKALQCFDAAMRLNSFSLAADELSVTPGAVGQQVRKLEEWLGVALFTRHIRQVQPTADGLAYWAHIRPALAQILQASRTLRDSRSQGVRLSMPPSLAAKWFAPRMSNFLTRHPDVALHLSSSTAVLDFATEAMDLAIRYFDGKAPNLSVQLLHQDQARLYCSPAYAAQLGLQKPADLNRATLLHNTLHPHWENWLQRFAGLSATAVATIPGVHFDQSLLAIDAATRGQGVVLTSVLLTEQEMASASLIEPFSERLDLPRGYYVVHPLGTPLRPAVQALKEWLVERVEL